VDDGLQVLGDDHPQLQVQLQTLLQVLGDDEELLLQVLGHDGLGTLQVLGGAVHQLLLVDDGLLQSFVQVLLQASAVQLWTLLQLWHFLFFLDLLLPYFLG